MGTNSPFGAYVKSQTNATGGTNLLVGNQNCPVFAGRVLISKPQGSTQTISSAAIDPTGVGTKILFTNLAYSDFSDVTQETITAAFGEIPVPAGCKYARLTGSISFTTQAGGTARWLRLVANTNTHKGNHGRVPTGVIPDICEYVSPIFPVASTDVFWVGVQQNSGSDIILSSGTETNNWASSWLQAEFFM